MTSNEGLSPDQAARRQHLENEAKAFSRAEREKSFTPNTHRLALTRLMTLGPARAALEKHGSIAVSIPPLPLESRQISQKAVVSALMRNREKGTVKVMPAEGTVQGDAWPDSRAERILEEIVELGPEGLVIVTGLNALRRVTKPEGNGIMRAGLTDIAQETRDNASTKNGKQLPSLATVGEVSANEAELVSGGVVYEHAILGNFATQLYSHFLVRADGNLSPYQHKALTGVSGKRLFTPRPVPEPFDGDIVVPAGHTRLP